MIERPLQEIARWMGCTTSSSLKARSFSHNSGAIEPGALFFAIKGERSDGHDFLSDVAKRGGIAAVVDVSYKGPDYGLVLLRVGDVVQALQKGAKEVVAGHKAICVAVTGSVGKTTTKEFLYALLKDHRRTWATPGNQNSQVGLPIALLHLEEDIEVMILEMAMSQQGQIKRLCEIAPPDVALITKVSLVHSQYFDSFEQIVEAKAEILSHPHTKIGFVDHELETMDEVRAQDHCLLKTYSAIDGSADYTLEVRDHELLIGADEKVVLPRPSIGGHLLHNLVGAVAVSLYLGLSAKELAASMDQIAMPKQRFCLQEVGGIQVIDDTYNASSLSVLAALEHLPEAKGRRIAILGSMEELGQFSSSCHREVAEYALDRVDKLYCLGELTRVMEEVWRKKQREVSWFGDRQSLIRAVREDVQKGDVVLVKGSRSLMMERVVEAIVEGSQ